METYLTIFLSNAISISVVAYFFKRIYEKSLEHAFNVRLEKIKALFSENLTLLKIKSEAQFNAKNKAYSELWNILIKIEENHIKFIDDNYTNTENLFVEYHESLKKNQPHISYEIFQDVKIIENICLNGAMSNESPVQKIGDYLYKISRQIHQDLYGEKIEINA